MFLAMKQEAYSALEGVSQQLGRIAAYSSGIVVALCPPQQLPAVDGALLHRETEAKADDRGRALCY
jgi:hypothetical protein